MFNKLRASERADETLVMLSYLGTQFCELIKTKHFDETLLKRFRCSACVEISPVMHIKEFIW